MAREYFQSAVALDPQYARAHVNIAWTLVCDVFLESPATATLDDAVREIEMAFDIDDSDAWSHLRAAAVPAEGGRQGRNPFQPGTRAQSHRCRRRRRLVKDPGRVVTVARGAQRDRGT